MDLRERIELCLERLHRENPDDEGLAEVVRDILISRQKKRFNEALEKAADLAKKEKTNILCKERM